MWYKTKIRSLSLLLWTLTLLLLLLQPITADADADTDIDAGTRMCNDENDKGGECNAENDMDVDADRYDKMCVDMHERCELWSDSGECLLNPSYMLSACERSCLVCVDPFMFQSSYDDDDSDNISEDLQRAYAFSDMDVGKTQAQSEQGWNGKVNEDIRQIIRDMEHYARHVITDPKYDGIRAQCSNKEGLCAVWAWQGECDKNPGFMIKSCSLACQKCHLLESFNKCSVQTRDNSEALDIHKGSIDELFESGITNRWSDLKYEVVYHPHSDNQHGSNEPPPSQPWLLRFDDVLTSEECDHLVALSNSLGWSTRTLVPAGGNTIGRTSASVVCNTLDCTNDNVLSKLFENLSSIIGVPARNMEHIEFLKYEMGESYGVHHDYIPEDFWKPSGTRALSVVLFLSDTNGGAIGFPELDWTIVPPKKGRAVVWANVLNNNPFTRDERMFHEALPVINGTKYAANIWVHQSDWQLQRQNTACL